MIDFDSSGLGDMEVWGRWGLGPELGRSGGALGFGLGLPTGRDGDPDTTDENIIFGAGDYSMLLSAEGFRKLGPAQAIFGLARYRLPLGAGSNGYRFGDDFGWAGTWQWRPRGGAVGLSLGLSGQHIDQDRQDGAPVASRGGRFHYAAAGISFPLGGKGTGGALVQRLVERSVRGDQLLSPWNFVVGYSLAWGEHTHPEPALGPRRIAP
ncbi:MAG: hypothetical protein V3U98_04760 [Acidobacteriota bacterium]